mgnify:CR=1 FL=1
MRAGAGSAVAVDTGPRTGGRLAAYRIKGKPADYQAVAGQLDENMAAIGSMRANPPQTAK